MMHRLAKSSMRVVQPLQQNNMLLAQMRYFAIIKKFTQTHEWIQYNSDSGLARIGITDHAQKELGDIVHVDMPKIGTKFEVSETLLSVESVKTAAEVYQMVHGEVVAVNEKLGDDSGLVNASAEDEGWMVEIKVTDPKQLDKLLTKEQYDEIAH